MRIERKLKRKCRNVMLALELTENESKIMKHVEMRHGLQSESAKTVNCELWEICIVHQSRSSSEQVHGFSSLNSPERKQIMTNFDQRHKNIETHLGVLKIANLKDNI